MKRAAIALVALLVSAGGPAMAQPPAPPILSTAPTPPPGSVPDPSQMSGFPLQVGDLPPGVLAVRVIRRSFANSVPGQNVEMYSEGGARAIEGITDAQGRAQFTGLAIGQTVHVRSVVDGEALESQRFQVPAQGGVRVVLVAGVGAGLPAAAAGPADPRAEPAEAAAAQWGSARLWVAAPLVALMLAGGVWLRRRPADGARAALMARRARTFDRLVALERESRGGRGDPGRSGASREALVRDLIALDSKLDDL